MRSPSVNQFSQRDLRLDLFRGLALWFIFIDHIPGNTIANLTIRNFGFSDATEIFVFISGYTAALVYGKAMDRGGFGASFWQIMRRVWQLYAAHIILFVIYVAQISWVATQFSNPVILGALNIGRFYDEPGSALVDALILQYRPLNLDILPLYMALLLVFPAVLWLLSKSAVAALAVSGALYVAVQNLKWSFPVYEDGSTWYFNPLGWQFLFVLGATFARSENVARLVQWRPWLGGAALAYLAFSIFIVLGWRYAELAAWVPDALAKRLYPIDKSNMDVLRLVHFLCIAYLVSHWIKPTSAVLRWSIWRPVVLCGQHSLYIFCLGISLSFLGYFVLDEFGRELPIQILTVLAGLLLMSASAWALHTLRDSSRTART